jgi:hypothetical protein
MVLEVGLEQFSHMIHDTFRVAYMPVSVSGQSHQSLSRFSTTQHRLMRSKNSHTNFSRRLQFGFNHQILTHSLWFSDALSFPHLCHIFCFVSWRCQRERFRENKESICTHEPKASPVRPKC